MDKKKLRRELKQRRSMIEKLEHRARSRRIINNLLSVDACANANTVFCYIPYQSEVDTTTFIQYCFDKGCYVAAPKVMSDTEMISVQISRLTDLVPDKMRMPAPKSDQATSVHFDVSITPGLGFTTKGGRLGYGRGYYDRWFSKNSVDKKIGVAFDIQIVAALPLEKTDILLDMIVTEEQIIDLSKKK